MMETTMPSGNDKTQMIMNDTDHMPDKLRDRVIGRIQTDFPVDERPFRLLAEDISCSEDELIESVKSLVSEGIIREFGPVFDARKLGYVSTLAAAVVEHDRVAELAADMLVIPEITHNYLRDHERNLWFTITARDNGTLKAVFERFKKFPGVKNIISLPVTKTYKIRAVFGEAAAHKGRVLEYETRNEHPAPKGQRIIRTLQENFPIEPSPYKTIAKQAGMEENEVMAIVSGWVVSGIIRRFGARLNHRRAGFTTNILTAWKGNETDSWGQFFADLPFVSHCYRRATSEGWDYDLYAMLHATSEQHMRKHLELMKTLAPGARFIQLKTIYELKKSAMKYFLEDIL